MCTLDDITSDSNYLITSPLNPSKSQGRISLVPHHLSALIPQYVPPPLLCSSHTSLVLLLEHMPSRLPCEFLCSFSSSPDSGVAGFLTSFTSVCSCRVPEASLTTLFKIFAHAARPAAPHFLSSFSAYHHIKWCLIFFCLPLWCHHVWLWRSRFAQPVQPCAEALPSPLECKRQKVTPFYLCCSLLYPQGLEPYLT